ncbi:MAG: DUF4038 domain-containing protein [Bryobacteraceae bacterium]|nr:DUF4038 domain-containing protein [Bryobacteraceae bacterium]
MILLRFAVIVACLSPSLAQAASPSSPYLQVSENGRYFVKDGSPFFWLGDTAWSIVNRYTPDEAEFYLESRRQQGFTVVHIMLLFDGGPGLTTAAANQRNELPFVNMDPATPNEAYFQNVDRIVRLAQVKGLVLVILPCGGSSGAFIAKKKIIARVNARAYGRWLGKRYREMPGIVWSNGFDLKPWMYEDVAREFAAGLRETDQRHLITYHPSGGASSSYFHHEDWLAANFIQTWADYLKIYPMVFADYLRTPPKPVVHAEGAYEEGPEYPTAPITPLLVRQQAYWAYMAGGFHSYGHNDMWRKNPTWKASLDAPGAKNMGVLKRILASGEWWKRVPDQSVFTAGASGDKTLNTALRSTSGDSAIVYLSSPTTVSIDMSKLTAGKTVRARWIHTETGAETAIGDFPNAWARSFTTPAGRLDAVLLLETAGK